MTYAYEDIVTYSPSLRCLLLVTDSLTDGVRYVFQTNQASQIANLMTRYCDRIRKQGTARRSVPRCPGGLGVRSDDGGSLYRAPVSDRTDCP